MEVRRLREFSVKGIAAVATVACLYPTPSSTIKSESSSITVIPAPSDLDFSPQKYPLPQNGEVTTPHGNFPIEGLRVKIDPQKLFVSEGQLLKISTVEKEWEEWTLGTSVIFKSSKDKNITLPESIKKNPLNIGNGKSDRFDQYGDSSLYKSSVYLPTTGAADGAVIIEKFNAKSGEKLSSNMYKEKFSKHCNTKVYLVEELHTTDSPKLCDTADLFEPYLKKKIGLIAYSQMKEEKYTLDGHWNSEDNVARVSLPEYKKNGKYEINAFVRFHELSHAAHAGMDDETKKSLKVVYTGLKTTVESGMSKSEIREKNFSGRIIYEPVWALLTESNYIRKVGVNDTTSGHPCDNANETLASTLTVLRTFPDLFVKEYPKLSPNERQVVAHTVVTAVEGMQSLNSDKTSMQKLLPELPTVLKTFASDSANNKNAVEIQALLKSVS